MTDERVFEVEIRQLDPGPAWVFVGNLPIKDYSILTALRERAEEKDWPDGEYCLKYWDESFASGSFYLVTLTSERKRTARMAESKPSEAAADLDCFEVEK